MGNLSRQYVQTKGLIMHDYLVKALIALAPNSSFSVNGDTYADIIWKSTEVTKPTETEVTTKLLSYKMQNR